MSRYRLCPPPAQEAGLLEHRGHARFVWNLAVEQHRHWKPGRRGAPGFAEQCRQLTEARAVFGWLRAASQTVQQQALNDFAQAMANFFGGTHRRPAWRKAGRHEGFRIVGRRGRARDVRRVSRRVGEVRVPKVGWVRFRWSRPVPDGVKSLRVRRDRAGRWHVGFAHVPAPIPAPGTGAAVGVDRGVTVSAALSTGELLHAPGLTAAEAARLRQPKVDPAYTSQTCHACGHRAPDNRESQAVFLCVACGHRANADLNAARDIRDTAVGRTVAARGGGAAARPVNREPQPDPLPV